MLQKAKSDTTLSKFPTNRGNREPKAPSSLDRRETPIQFIKGVGPRLGAIFQSRGIHTAKDLLYFFPRAYEDRTRISKVSELQERLSSTVAVRVLSSRSIPIKKLGRSMFEVRCADEMGDTLGLKWFHTPRGMEARFTPGAQIMVTGSVKFFMGKPEIVHPEITWGTTTALVNVGRVVPIYTEIESVSSRVLRKILWEALQAHLHSLKEDLPEKFLRTHQLPKLSSAIRVIHFPEDTEQVQGLVEFDTPAHHRLIYEEFLKFEYLVLRRRLRMEKRSAAVFGKTGGYDALRSLESLLPFRLTQGQAQALQEIASDLAQPHPMNRLAQGDVGSGKTAVGFLGVGCVLAEGGQATLMAPTEILAEQHYKNAVKIFGGRLNVALLTGKTTSAERNLIQARIGSGEPLLLIGTHALLEAPVVFKNLAFILIDEQHRFGVEQRRTLRQKGVRVDPETGQTLYPHTLILTATPIPRTLALTAYGDLSVSTIRELPPGRTPVKTRVIREKADKGRVYEQIRQQLKAGRQAYFIYPLVNESEAEGFTQLKSAVIEAETLAREVFPEFRVGLLHGQLKPQEKTQIMELFQRGELHILVSTTVVEVGVDVPNATIIAIEHAERFGLSQLHQLRGRVGRGSSQSYCFLFSKKYTAEVTAARLEVLEGTNDGFKIAEADLEIRGPGEFLGTRQAGGLPFRLAHLVRDQAWLLRARDDATELLRTDPDLKLPEHDCLRKFYEREGKLQFERLGTS